MASLVQQKGSFYAQFFDSTRQPKRKQVPLRTKRRRIAERLFRRLEDDYALGDFDPWGARQEGPELHSIGDAYAAFLDARANLRYHTLEKYRSVIGLFVRYLGETYPLAQIQPRHIDSFLNARERKPVTRKTYATTLSPLFSWLVESKVLKTNPVQGVRLERVPAKFPRYLSRQEVSRLTAAVKQDVAENPRVEDGTCLWIVPIVEANVYLGLRAGEVCNLRWEDVDFSRETLTVRNREGFATKSGKERTLPLPAQPLAVLRELATRGAPAEANVFKVSPTSRALRPRYLSRRFKRYVRLAGLPEDVSFHTTRHTCASWLAESGCGIEAIRLYLGHSSVAVTQRYMHLSPTALASQVRAAFGGWSATAANVTQQAEHAPF